MSAHRRRRRVVHAITAAAVASALGAPVALAQSNRGGTTGTGTAAPPGAGATGASGTGAGAAAGASATTPPVGNPEVGASATGGTTTATTSAPAAGASSTTAPPPGDTSATGTTAGGEHRAPWGHRYQVSFRVAGSLGYMFAIRYGGGMGDSDNCATAYGGSMSGAVFCYGRSPVMVDTAVGFGVTETLELEARFRFGELLFLPGSMSSTGIPLALGVGIRYYGNDDSRLKFLLGVAAFVDFTDRVMISRFGTDVQVRLEQGLQYDIFRQFGVYVQLGETFGFVRNLSAVLDGGLGVQARVP